MSHPTERVDWGERIPDPNYGFRQLFRLPNGWTIIRRNLGVSTKPPTWLVGVSDGQGLSRDPYKLLRPLPDGKPRSTWEDDKRFLNEALLQELVEAVEAQPLPRADG